MASNRWHCNVASYAGSPTWEDYADRCSAVLRAISRAPPGDISWRWPVEGNPPFDIGDTARIRDLIIGGLLRDDGGDLVPGGSSHTRVVAERRTAAGPSDMDVYIFVGRPTHPLYVNLQVTEAEGSLWRYPDQTLADLVAAMLQAVAGHEAKIMSDDLLDLLIRQDVPAAIEDLGSHIFRPAPLDAAALPAGTRQVRCGDGVLLISLPADDPDHVITRLRHLASALG